MQVNAKSVIHSKQNVERRSLVDKIVPLIVMVCVLTAIVPLCSILVEVFRIGISAITLEFLPEVHGAIGMGEGGIGPAIRDTLVVVGLATKTY